MNSLRILSDGLRISARGLAKHFVGLKKYDGDSENICRQILEDCFDKKLGHFNVSVGHFRQFYCRDFGMICESLISLGYKERVISTLNFAMSIFEKEGKITTHITPSGKSVDFPFHTPESTAYMLHSILLTKDKKLLERYKYFISSKAKQIYENDIDKKTGLLRKDKFFSSMKDHSERVSDCYNNCMLGMLSVDLKKSGIKCELSKFDYSKIIKKYFWNGDYFVDDLSGNNVLSGDANTFPFWTGLIKDKKMFQSSLKWIKKHNLDSPWPLKYTRKGDVQDHYNIADYLVPGYEYDTLWMHLGSCFLKVVSMFDKKQLKIYLKSYEKLVVKHKNFLELYESDGKPFRRLLYYSDEGMSWCAIFLDLKKKYLK
ncbi:hypothetical protein K9L67_01260 [Candidatus Woesearchaeota archaeon]|nr:hypothetical protein [Candidatus Woesearchaeota archaeon]MCF7900832.1 hypothetical protein [Candidatus Woesearchaeota archaeon]MCF8014069.1 hypothetical protein [Candidatus Woesearchaeota archaeon]